MVAKLGSPSSRPTLRGLGGVVGRSEEEEEEEA
jgi:hypothetical protein